MSLCFRPEKLSHHRRVTRVTKIFVNVTDKIEKSGELGIADSFGMALFAFRDFVQERQDLI